jgi:hypothetical protein
MNRQMCTRRQNEICETNPIFVEKTGVAQSDKRNEPIFADYIWVGP